MDFWKNKKVVITGGTSGLGLALTQKLESQGASLFIVARDKMKLQEIYKKYDSIEIASSDLSLKEAILPLAGQIHSALGEVDVLFNVASELGPTPLRLLVDTECEDFERVLQTNLLGPFRLTKALLPSMLLKERGWVVNISSDASVSAYPKWGAYSVSKAAVDHLSRIFSVELENQNIKFYSFDPGDMNTPMHFKAIPEANPSELRDPAVSAQLILDSIVTNDSKEVRRKA